MDKSQRKLVEQGHCDERGAGFAANVVRIVGSYGRGCVPRILLGICSETAESGHRRNHQPQLRRAALHFGHHADRLRTQLCVHPVPKLTECSPKSAHRKAHA